jgi:hypothetical protein
LNLQLAYLSGLSTVVDHQIIYVQFTLCAARPGLQRYSGATTSSRAKLMWIMAVYVAIVVVAELVVVAIGVALDRVYPTLSLTVSLSLFFTVLWFGWVLAVHLTEPKRAKSERRAT